MILNLFWVLTVTLLTAGCAPQQTSLAPAPKHILELKAEKHRDEPTSQNSINSAESVSGQLTMASAMALALKNNPSLSVYLAEIQAKQHAALQAGLLPNPEFSVELENSKRKDAPEWINSAATTFSLSQLVELGGKGGRRQSVATQDKNLAEWDYQSKKLDILATTAKAFVEVLIAQEQVALNGELLTLAEKTTVAVSEKVAAGKVSPVEKTRVHIELAAARNEANKAVRELEAARRRLAKQWGKERATFGVAVGTLDEISALPSEESLETFLSNNPDLARWSAEINRSEASLSLARSTIFPDLTISAGVIKAEESKDNALTVGISVPLPFFNRNQGGVAEARAGVERVKWQHKQAAVDLMSNLSDTWQELSIAYTEATSLRDEILPNAQEAYQSIDIAYRNGKLDLLQMLDAQRTLFTVKRQYLLSLGAYYMASTDMERLTGVSLNENNKSINENQEGLNNEK